jgi:predicted alpha-1,2-mannosidase
MLAAVRSTLLIALVAGASACTESASPTPSHPVANPGPEADFAIAWRKSPPVSPMLIGSGGFGYWVGSTTGSAAAPQGLVKVGPDTDGPWGTINFLHCSGYWYGDNIIQGFSHLHLHGTGATDYGVLGVMPVDTFDASDTTEAGYQSTFQKPSESASPGRYTVTLDNGGILVELTATPHAAHHRYTYAASATTGHVIFDLAHHLDGGSITDGLFTLDPTTNHVHGQFRSIGGMSGGFGGYMVYFEAVTRAPWTESLVWQDGSAPAQGSTATGTSVGFELGFDLAQQAPVELQVGLSLVSAEEAAANLAAEMPSFDFDGEAKSTADAWSTLLDTVRVTGGTADQQSMMTAAIYHAFLMPTVQSDVDGSYRGMDDQIHVAQGFRYVSDMSLWDTYRTLHPLYALIAPDRALDSVQSLYAKGQQGGFFPRWPIAWGEAGTMIAASAEIVVADAYVKGITGFDAEGAYQILRAAAMDPTAPPGGRGGRNEVEPYMKYGYVPEDVTTGSVSWTTEYANDDFALSALAEGLGYAADASALRARAVGYRKLYDPVSGFLWSKNSDGSWATPHDDPTDLGDEFVEADAWQSMWMVTLDVDGLAALAGGRENLVAKLVSMFEQTKTDFATIDFSDQLKSAGPLPYYWAGNEPDLAAVYYFALLGEPELTQKWVAWIRATQYTPGADGLPGNDDSGTMSAWWAWSALGIYPLAGSDRYVVGAPLFPRAEVAVPGGTFTIVADGVSDTNLYVQSAKLNGAPLAAPQLRHADLKAGGSLEFTMGPLPSAWGRVN